MFTLTIEMPSGMRSRERELKFDDAVALEVSYARQMKAWKDFEAWILILEDGREIQKEHIKT